MNRNQKAVSILKVLRRIGLGFLSFALVLILITQAATFGAKTVQADSYTYNDDPSPNLSIPDNGCASPTTRSFNITDNFTITDLNVGFTAAITRRGDIRVELTSPTATTVRIIQDNLTDFSDNYDVLLDSASGNPLSDGSDDPIGGTPYQRTAAPSNSLNSFNGQNSVGTWTLSICDNRTERDLTYYNARLAFTGDPVTTGIISGSVFQDYNGDGTRTTTSYPTTSAADRGISSVTVRLYSLTGAAMCSTTTDSSGNYSFNTNNCNTGNTAITGPYRVEFTGLPSGYQPGARSTDSVNGGSSTNSGTAVQFVSSSTATNVNLAINHPSDYCQNFPTVYCPAYSNGNPLGGGVAGTETFLYSFPYGGNDVNQNQNDTTTNPTSEATGAEIGATWGLAFSRTRNLLFMGAVQKRHVGYGPLGIGGIYYLNTNTSAVTEWVDLDTITGIDAGTDPHSGLPSGGNTASYDVASFDAVGKLSLGDIDISDDETTLWAVNLNDRTLLEIPLGSGSTPTVPSSVGTGANDIKEHDLTGAVTCTNGTFRPWALKFYRGLIYVGGVCDATGGSGTQANLQAYILSHDPSGTIGSFTTVTSFGLNYNKSCAFQDAGGSPEYDCDGWERWQSSWSSFESPVLRNGGNDFYFKPQPILSDIEFDVDGSMILGVMDRWGMQTGYDNRQTNTNDNGLYNGVASSDILRVCLVSGSYQLENTGSCTASKNNLNGGLEFYDDDTIYNGIIYHPDSSLGALAFLPGSGEILTTSMDNTDTWEQGVVWLDNNNGELQPDGGTTNDRNYRLLNDLDDTQSGGKASGLGDLELLCNAAPLELGNRVWRDDDGDGVQDPTEMPIAGLTVQLVRAGTVYGTAVTDSNGEYYFVTNTAGDGDANNADNIGYVDDNDAGVQRSTAYVIRIDPLAGNNANLLNGLGITTANASDLGGADGGTNADARDSDAALSSTNYEISLTTGSAGNNTHSLDFGFAPLGSIGNRVWIDEDSNGYQDEGEDGIPNVVVELKNSGGTVIATTRTDSQGYYLFPNLAAGTYFVEVQSGIPSGMTQTDITVNPNPGADLFNQDQTTNANGYQIVLGAGQDNLTADFGYNWNPTDDVNNGTKDATASIGDRVWIDSNGNGRQDAGEVGVNNVEVTLYYDFDNDGDLDDDNNGSIDTENQYTVGGYDPTTNTDQNGNYIFNTLPPGAYYVQVTNSGSASHDVLGASYTQTGDPDHYGTTGTNNDNRTTTAVILGPGDVFLDADFGYDDTGITLGQIGNFVWFDRDADGVGPSVDANGGASGGAETHGATGTADSEEGIGGVSVALIRDLNDNGVWDSGEPIIATQFTSNGSQDVDGDGFDDAKGAYNFRGLNTTTDTGNNRNDYLVVVTDVNRVLDGLTPTYDNDTTGDNLSRVQNLGTTAITTEDFGYTPDNSGQQASRTTLSTTATGVIGDRVWLDIDSGDDQDANEPGIQGVRVYLYQDSDGDGTLDAGEPLIATTSTGPDGYYLFPNLTTGTSGDYIVQVDTTTLPGGLTQTYDQDAPQTDSTSNVQNLAGTDLTQDFGYVGTGTIGNLVWNDVDADGVKDASESGIDGVTLDLYYDKDGDGKIDAGEPKLGTTTTAGGGTYLFSGLPTDDGGGNAQYIVDVTDTAGKLAGYWHSLGTAGTNDNSQTDPYAVTLTPGAPNNLTADFGYYVKPAAIGNFVWNDADGDGIQDSGEAGINGVVMKLTITYPGPNKAIGGGDDTVTTLYTVTGDDPSTVAVEHGWYSFANLLQDEDYNGADSANQGEPTFSVSVNTPQNTGALAGLYATQMNQGGDDKVDSDNPAGVAATATEGQQSVTQTSPASNEGTLASYDFGYRATPTSVDLGAVTATANEDGTVTLKWESLSELNMLGFNILRGEKRKDISTQVNTELVPALTVGAVTGNLYEYTDTSVLPNTTYFYKVEVLRADNGSTKSEAVKVTTLGGACSAAPAAPALLGPENEKQLKKAKAKFTWNTVECAASYKWQLRADNSDGELVATKKNLPAPETAFRKLERGKTYVWRVAACNADGKCEWSEWWSFTIRNAKK